MKKNLILILSILVSFISSALAGDEQTIAIVGGTVLDVSNGGKSSDDIVDAVVLIKGERIEAIGAKGQISIPDGAKIIDAKGKFILPGLIDGFGAIDNQAFAGAYLYMGCTSVVALEGMRRHPMFEDADPGPRIFKAAGVALHGPVNIDSVLSHIEEYAKEGIDLVLLMYGLQPDQLKAAVEKVHSLGMGSIGELGFTRYKQAVEIGIHAFVHTDGYSRDLAPVELANAIAADHHGMKSKDHIVKYQQMFIDMKADDPALLEYAEFLGNCGVSLMPTISLDYLSIPGHSNPWDEPAAKIINPEDIYMPANQETGERDIPEKQAARWVVWADAMLRLDSAYAAAGAIYLAGSGTDLLGTLPGVSLHTELEMLMKIGLSARQAIAAASSNYVDTFGWKEVGLLETGRYADVLVIDANPLEDINNLKNIVVLMKGGEIIDREALLK